MDGSKFWIDAGVDAIRIDAIKHMDKSFIQKWTSDIYDYSKSIGREGFFFFGEWFGASANTTTGVDGNAIDYANTSGSALLDFGFRDTLERVLVGRSGNTMKTLNSYLIKRQTVFTSDDWQVVFMDNHDMARIGTALRSNATTFGPGNNETGGSQSEAFAQKRIDLGLVATMTVRGIPAIYYGTEHYAANFTSNSFGQVGSDPYNREKMPGFDTESEAFSIIKTLGDLRKSSPAIQNGTYTELWVNDDILVFERRSGNDIVIVALNRGEANTINVKNIAVPNGVYPSLIGNNSVSVANKQATLTLMQNEAVVIRSQSDDAENPTVQSINFTCNNGYTISGQSVYIIGNIPQLGGWDLTKAVKISPTQYPQWSASLELPSDLNVEWKCVKRNETNPTANVEWQSGANNQFNSNDTQTTNGSF